MRKLMLLLIAMIIFAVSCEDRTTNNFYSQTTGFAGTVAPIDTGTVMAIIASDTFRTKIDASGFFIFQNLRPGSYHVVVQPFNYTRRELFGQVLLPGQIIQLKNIALSHYPYPFYRSNPKDGDTVIDLYSDIALYTDEALEFNDLINGATFDPPLEGTWLGRNQLNYAFRPTARFRVGTGYRLTLPSTIRTATGTPLGSNLTLNFMIEPLTVTVVMPDPRILGGVPINDFIPIARFNDSVNIDSLQLAVTFEPAIEGLWHAYPYYSYYTFFAASFTPTSGSLQAETTYKMIFSDQVNLCGSAHLPKADTILFVTEPYGVISVSPGNGQWASISTEIGLSFNISMDTIATSAAFSLTDIEGNAIAGRIAWNSFMNELFFTPSGGALQAGKVYRIYLSTAAKILSGENLKHEFRSYFLAG